MSPIGKHKSEAALDGPGLSAWLRGLADGIDAGELDLENGSLSLEGFRNLKVSIKPGQPGGYLAKLSVKYPKPAGAWAETVPETAPLGEVYEPATGEALPKYKSLKKHMKYTFKAIGLALAAGKMPPEMEARSFVADSRLMVSYPGKGDEFYAAYLEKTQAFEAALDAQDLAALQTLHAELAQLKRDCHSRWA